MKRQIVFERVEDGIAVFEVLPEEAETETRTIEYPVTDVPAEYSPGDIIIAILYDEAIEFISIDEEAMRAAREKNAARRARLRGRILRNQCQ